MVIIKTPAQIEGIRQSSQLAARTLNYLATFLKPGLDTEFLDQLAVKFIAQHHAIAAPLNYNGFPKSICTSINNVVCHGIPSPNQILKSGDIINLDITTILNGYYGDVSATFPIGKVSPLAKRLIDVTQKSLNLAINSIAAGKSLNSCVGQQIEDFVTKFGFSPVRDLGGHGVGLKFHEDPFVYHFKTKNDDLFLKEGMIFTIEPMINSSLNWQVTLDPRDGWTVRTKDGSLSAQFEHTILVTKNGAEILTQL